MRRTFRIHKVAPQVYELAYRRCLFFWIRIGKEHDGKFFPKRFETVEDAIGWSKRESASL